MTEKHSIIMTRSMERVLREKKLPLETALDFPQMYKLFSPNDLAAFVSLQVIDDTRVLHDNSDISNLSTSLERLWTNNYKLEFPELVNTVRPMSYAPTVLQTLRDQLTLPQGCEVDKDANPIQIYDTAKDVFFIVIDTGYKEYMSYGVNEIAVVRAIMTVLMNYTPLNILAQSHKVFKRWIRLAAVNNVLRPPQPVIE